MSDDKKIYDQRRNSGHQDEKPPACLEYAKTLTGEKCGPPVSLDAERSVLGAILLDNRLYFQAATRPHADDFSLDAHRRIYACMRDLQEAGRVVDMITLVEELDRRGEIAAIGGVVYLSSLIDVVLEHGERKTAAEEAPLPERLLVFGVDEAGLPKIARYTRAGDHMIEVPEKPTSSTTPRPCGGRRLVSRQAKRASSGRSSGR